MSRSRIPTADRPVAATASATAPSTAPFRAAIRVASARCNGPGSGQTRVWSWKRSSSTVAPARSSSSSDPAQSRRSAAGSKSERRVSFIPTHSTTTSAPDAAAAGT
ncbi:hypothetical protein WY02_04095 [Pseudonocardia sp. AL041005-10]|nr:hypothetical protein WY02_04095 [Pseudonocardia sp. AL041005-10]